MLDLSVVIPIYNSKDFIASAVQELTAFCDRHKWAYEILLRDDGSTDGSGDILRRLSHQYPRVRGVFNETNHGLGFTLRRLFEEAQGRTVVYCDVDLPFGVDVLKDLVALNQEHDLVVVSRYFPQAQSHIPFLRKTASRLYFRLCRMLFRVPVLDIGSGTVALSREALMRIPLQSDGFDIHIEIITAFRKQRCSLLEIPAPYFEKGPGTFSILRHGPRVFIDTLRLWRRSLK